MDTDDLEPINKPKKPTQRDLDPMSVEALQDYITELEAEIARARAKIADKMDARSAADSVFKN